jgi:endonuclease/exonuclease/phosphatase family metal-dependent hydrolase
MDWDGIDKSFEKLDRDYEFVRRLKIIILIKSGASVASISSRYHISKEEIYRLNAAYTQNGVWGIAPGSDFSKWFEQLGKLDDKNIRRLEMIRLKKAGTPLNMIAQKYDADEDYIAKLDAMFDKRGVVGILNDDDIDEYHHHIKAISAIRILTYNLHGEHYKNYDRLEKIARDLSDSRFSPDICALQEVIKTNAVPDGDTGLSMARHFSKKTGYNYHYGNRVHFVNCHKYQTVFDEGVSIVSRHWLKIHDSIDLNANLKEAVEPIATQYDVNLERCDLAPSMARYAAVAEIHVNHLSILFASAHLDHKNKEVRLAQVKKLVDQLTCLELEKQYHCTVIAGDLNDVESMPALCFLRDKGYSDSYRACHHYADGFTCTTENPYARIDYILVKKGQNVDHLQVNRSEIVLQNPEYSDHLGLFTEIEIKI